MRFRSALVLALFIAVSLLAGIVGSASMGDSVSTWYPTLQHPWWTPPTWVFGPVWTTLYVLMGIAAFLVSCSRKKGKYFVLWLYVAHLLVNAFWTVAFFALHELTLSVLVILVLLGLIGSLMRLFYPHSKAAAYLLVPYLLWVLYATTLSIGFLALN